MVEVTSKTGITKDLHLDFDAIVAYEEKNPDYSFIDDIGNLGDKMRFATLDRLTKLVYDGQGWKQFVADGFSIKELSLAITEGMKELGFIPEDSPGAE